MENDGLALIDPQSYAAHGAPHETWARLRAEAPVTRFDPPGYEPFWAITKHADIWNISKSPDRFLNSPGIVVLSDEQRKTRDSGEGLAAMRTIIEMDPPEHVAFRKVVSARFTPRALDQVVDIMEESARTALDALGDEGECDLATSVAVSHPLRVLSQLLGVPREAEPQILRLTNELFGADDPELRRDAADHQQAIMELGAELFELFTGIIEDRRANPRDDLATILANGVVNGEPMPAMETFGYFLIVFTAGHDTTKNSIAGGFRALAENPGELDKLRRNPGLLPTAIEEIVRWTTPVNYMRRTAARDVEVRGQKIREGEHLALFYASANRDEDVFEDPFVFKVDRDPNPHLGFGIGEHFCLGANLARRSQQILFRQVIERIESLEIVGEPEHIASNFVVGVKHLPVRYRFRPS